MPETARCTWLYLICVSAVAVMLGACARQTDQVAIAAVNGTGGEKMFTSARYGIHITYPEDLELRRTFTRSYLASSDWKTYTGPDSPQGEPVVALVMPASNSVTAGELRIGASRQPDAVQTCTQSPAATVRDSQGQAIISGVPFTTFKARDAAMSHYLIVRSYRVVHDDTCYAIDVLVFGTNPQVYDPPATPPFTRAQVFARLVPVVQNLQFLTSPAGNAMSSPIAPPATYRGLLPCADCPGIDYQLNLLADHRYRLRMNYRDRDARFDDQGHWQVSNDGETLTLHSGNSSPVQPEHR